MQFLPTLYQKTNTGAIQYWKIGVDKQTGQMDDKECAPEWGLIVTEYGHVGTESPQRTSDIVTEGKFKGKKNATSAFQQAVKEAEAKWLKQKKKGYVETIEAAQAEEVDAIIEGGVAPMLAERYMDVVYSKRPGEEGQFRLEPTKASKKIKFPCLVQPKLDGIRCVAVIVDGKCSLWSRTRKPIKSVPHIVEELEEAFAGETITLDGELYNHALKHNFQKITSIVSKKEPDLANPDMYLVEYHVYDLIPEDGQPPLTQANRYMKLAQLFNGSLMSAAHIAFVRTGFLDSAEMVKPALDRFIAQGYEGIMLRNRDAEYRNDRSGDLQKVKNFDEDEFAIIGVTEGRGKMAGAAIFNCKTKAGVEFDCKLEGPIEYLKTLFRDHTLWTSKQLTVTYQGFTKDGRPRFPVGKAIRDYE